MSVGVKYGPGKLYYETGSLWFEGDFKDDKFHGAEIYQYYLIFFFVAPEYSVENFF